MPLSFKQEKPTKARKPLSSSTNTRDSISRKQKSYSKKEHLKQPQQKLVNKSTLNIKTINTQKQPKINKDLYFINHLDKAQSKTISQQHYFSPKSHQLSSKNNQKLKQSWGKLKQSVKQVYFYDKYSKKDIVNISIIEEKSLLSNNQQNSLDSLNNFIIEGNNEDKSLLQKSHESSSFDNDEEDWSLMQKQYEEIIKDDEETLRQAEYLRLIVITGKQQHENEENSQQSGSPFISVNQQIFRLNQQIKKLKQLKNSKQNMIEGSSQVINNLTEENEANQNEQLQNIDINVNSGSSEGAQNLNGTNIENLQGQQHNEQSQLFQNSKSLGFSMQKSQQLKLIVRNLRRLQKSDKQKILIKANEQSVQMRHNIQIQEQELQQHGQDQELLAQQEQQEPFQEEQKSLVIEQEQFQNQSILQDSKSQQQFIRYMDKEYLQKKQSQDNQPNLSLNNISNIMKIKPLELHNKSIQNQHEIKEKQDDEVVAMLQNQLRGKQSKLKTRSHTYSANNQATNMFLKQQNLLQLKQEDQQNILKEDNQILLKDDNQIILMKQSRDNIGLNQSDYQANIQAEQSNEENNNFFFVLDSRQKWIKSLDKDNQWKLNQLALIAKMKKILHNPYIQFQDY